MKSSLVLSIRKSTLVARNDSATVYWDWRACNGKVLAEGDFGCHSWAFYKSQVPVRRSS